jgi:Enoyl-(Acyl carrier protein) reductase
VRALVETSGKPFEELWRTRGEANPAKRYGRPAELGAYCAFLCSQRAGFITGQNLLIDGGSYPGMPPHRRITSTLALALAAPMTVAASADEYPSRTVTVVVPFPAGGSVDGVARILVQKLNETIGQHFIVENRAGGASGIVGANAAPLCLELRDVLRFHLGSPLKRFQKYATEFCTFRRGVSMASKRLIVLCSDQ